MPTAFRLSRRQVLDADGFEAFTEAGDCFDQATAARLKTFVYRLPLHPPSHLPQATAARLTTFVYKLATVEAPHDFPPPFTTM